MNSQTPDVSVILACYHAANLLPASLESVLRQTLQSFELVCVDDGSTDQTAMVLEKYRQRDPRVVLLRNATNEGLTRSLNHGIAVARGRYIARLDTGDGYRPEKLACQLKFMDEHPEVILCATQVIFVAEGREVGRSRFACDDAGIRRRMESEQGIFCHPSIMFRNRGIWYNEVFRYSQDLELYMRLSLQGQMHCLDECLTTCRIDPAGLTLSRKYEQRQYQRLAYQIYRRYYRLGKIEVPPEIVRIHDRWLGRWLCGRSMVFYRRYAETRTAGRPAFRWMFWLGLSLAVYPPLIVDYLRKLVRQLRWTSPVIL